ncbi:EamA family transporter [Lysinibacillus fusiformis]|uniref:EamA family transporter n=1 Tax=Lysinibacillus fusiformis TaxID=28031 RepID=UPI002E22572A|nr:EamA family transporter [Lysinibacillus fusiformis]MED4889240.1 EamA family transporter [Lysinibacillus fusiformis]
MKIFLFILNVLLLVIGQTLWKIGAEKIEISGLRSLMNVVLSPWIIGGGVLYVIATAIWLYLLSKLPLSLIYPLQSVAYVIALFVALLIFKEAIPITRWVGVAVILFGVYLVTK